MAVTEHAWTPLVVIHAIAASLAMVIGIAQILRRRRGDRPHRAIGWTWVVLMYFTAGSSFFIRMIRPGSFSWIHALSALTIVTLTLGLWNARRGRPAAHAGNMIGTYLGLVGAFVGVVAVPSRLVPQAFQSSWVGMGALTALVVAGGLGLVAALVKTLGSAMRPAST
jgi:uncharacterized membrane protein